MVSHGNLVFSIMQGAVMVQEHNKVPNSVL